MDREQSYRAALDITHQMLAAAVAQDWPLLTDLERRRTEVFAALAPILPTQKIDAAQAQRITQAIGDIERDSAEVLEYVEAWQKDVKRLLQQNNKTPI